MSTTNCLFCLFSWEASFPDAPQNSPCYRRTWFAYGWKTDRKIEETNGDFFPVGYRKGSTDRVSLIGNKCLLVSQSSENSFVSIFNRHDISISTDLIPFRHDIRLTKKILQLPWKEVKFCWWGILRIIFSMPHSRQWNDGYSQKKLYGYLADMEIII